MATALGLKRYNASTAAIQTQVDRRDVRSENQRQLVKDAWKRQQTGAIVTSVVVTLSFMEIAGLKKPNLCSISPSVRVSDVSEVVVSVRRRLARLPHQK